MHPYGVYGLTPPLEGWGCKLPISVDLMAKLDFTAPLEVIMEAPKGLILFAKTPVGQDLQSKYNQISLMVLGGSVFSLILGYFIHQFVYLVSVGLLLVALRTWQSGFQAVDVPLAVNLNHPFMMGENIGNCELMVGFDDWKNPEENRFMVHYDVNIKSWIVLCQDAEKSLFSKWECKYSKKIIQRQTAIINQALALRDATNDVEDDFESARLREKEDTGLLEREWMPDEEIEVLGPISRIFTKD
tara:strand:- start:1221 stop:1952 length:732 start_codon:yes stop_codon:yes gene_type:complete